MGVLFILLGGVLDTRTMSTTCLQQRDMNRGLANMNDDANYAEFSVVGRKRARGCDDEDEDLDDGPQNVPSLRRKARSGSRQHDCNHGESQRKQIRRDMETIHRLCFPSS